MLKSISVTKISDKQVEIQIVVRTHWLQSDGPNLRSLAKQKDFDRAAAEAWSGSFKKKKSAFSKPLIEYLVRTTFESTYGDQGDADPESTATVVLQSPEQTGGKNRPDAIIAKPSEADAVGSIQLFRGDSSKMYAHEMGHRLGLEDAYEDRVGPNGKRTSVKKPGWEENIMATALGKPDYRNFEDLIRIWGK